MDNSRPGENRVRAKTVRLRSRTRSRSRDRRHRRSPSPPAASNWYSSTSSTSSKHKRSPSHIVHNERGAGRSTKRSQTTYHPRKVSPSPNAIDPYQRRRRSTSRTTISPSFHRRRSRREDHSPHYPSPLRGQNSSPSPERFRSNKIRQRGTKSKGFSKLAPSSSPSPPPSPCHKQQRRGATVANGQTSRYLSPQQKYDESVGRRSGSHSKSSHKDPKVQDTKSKRAKTHAPAAFHKIKNDLELTKKRKVGEIELIDLVGSKKKKKKGGKESNTLKEKHVKKKKKKKDESKEREISVDDMIEKVHPNEAYYKPSEIPTSARNNYIKCRICLSYFQDDQERKNQHLSLHDEQTFCVKVPRDHWFFNIEDAIQHLAKMHFSKEDLKKKMKELKLVIYPNSLYGYSCSTCRQGSSGNIIDFANNRGFLNHVKEFKCAEPGMENDVRVSWCRGCHIRFATHKDLDVHIRKQLKGEGCFLGNDILDEIYLKASQETSSSVSPAKKHQDLTPAIKTEANPYYHGQLLLPHQLPQGVIIPSSSGYFEPIHDIDNHPTSQQILPHLLCSSSAPNNSLSSGAEEGFNVYSDMQRTSVNTSLESQSSLPPDKTSDSLMLSKSWELEMQQIIQAANKNMLKPSKEGEEEVGNQHKDRVEAGEEEEHPDKMPLFGKPLPVSHETGIPGLITTQQKNQNLGSSSRVDDSLAFKPIRIFSKYNLNRSLDLTSPNIGQECSGDQKSSTNASQSSRNPDETKDQNNKEYEDATRGLEDEHTRNPNFTEGFEARVDTGTLYNHELQIPAPRNKRDPRIAGIKPDDQPALNHRDNEPAVHQQENDTAVLGQVNDEEAASSSKLCSRPEILAVSSQKDYRKDLVEVEKNIYSEMCSWLQCSWLQCSWNSEHVAGCRRLQISKRCGAGLCKNSDLHQCLDMKQNKFVPSTVKNNNKNQICPKLGLYVNYALTNPGKGRTADKNVRMIPLSGMAQAGSGASPESGSEIQDPRLPLLANGVYPSKKIEMLDEFSYLAHPSGIKFIFANWRNNKFADLFK